jgi:hypothetical protein
MAFLINIVLLFAYYRDVKDNQTKIILDTDFLGKLGIWKKFK